MSRRLKLAKGPYWYAVQDKKVAAFFNWCQYHHQIPVRVHTGTTRGFRQVFHVYRVKYKLPPRPYLFTTVQSPRTTHKRYKMTD